MGQSDSLPLYLSQQQPRLFVLYPVGVQTILSYHHGICLPSSPHHPLTPLQAAQHSQGIQTLLEAEKEAAKIVQQARQCILHTASSPTPAHAHL